jgi:ketosteroid isomerase-like protein
MAEPSGVVERFFVYLTARDWAAFGALLADDVERVGPFGDRAVGRARYVDFLQGLVPSDYGNDVHRITYAADGRSAFARVTEHLVYPHGTFHLEEAYAFEIGENGSIEHLEVFWQTPDTDPAGLGSATGEDWNASPDG